MKVALITGANRGIGFATARLLAKHDHHVIVASRNPAAGEEAAQRLAEEGHSASSLALDVTDPTQIRSAVADVSERFGHLDVLVNNAGILPEATEAEPGSDMDVAMFEKTFATNVFGPVAVSSAFLPLLRESTAGRIVNVSSTMGSLTDQSDPESPYYPMMVPAYRASKAALNNVTVALAKALAQTPVKVTSVCPGWVQTDLAPGNRQQAPTPSEVAAEVVAAAATLPEDAASGTFVDAHGTVPW
ncbi:SDR family oxidoreductase [Mumia zhuanghuii]|uniref:SDR family oxidoreductase n=2 Tax=Mumia TaxID=1546255 RepID=A0ABW1QHV6_9ACTN|nr:MULTISPECIES: SDR family oxidoreductase [Mumia]KAA1424562.1 SDR family oxidoreductase [Mumia zhuanghuii]